MVGQPPNRKGAIESLKGDESFRNCYLNNWSSWHMLLTCCDTIHSLLIPTFSAHHIHSFLAACCIVTSVFRCLRSFISGSGCSMTRNMKGICSWLTINWFRPSLLSRKYHCALLSLSFSASSSVLILQCRNKVYAWQGTTWKHDFKCFSHEYIYIKICKKFKCMYSWTFA